MVSSPNTCPVSPGSTCVRRPLVERKCITPANPSIANPAGAPGQDPRSAMSVVPSATARPSNPADSSIRRRSSPCTRKSRSVRCSPPVNDQRPDPSPANASACTRSPVTSSPCSEGTVVKPTRPKSVLAEEELPGRERQGGEGARVEIGRLHAVPAESGSYAKRSKSAITGSVSGSGGKRTEPRTRALSISTFQPPSAPRAARTRVSGRRTPNAAIEPASIDSSRRRSGRDESADGARSAATSSRTAAQASASSAGTAPRTAMPGASGSVARSPPTRIRRVRAGTGRRPGPGAAPRSHRSRGGPRRPVPTPNPSRCRFEACARRRSSFRAAAEGRPRVR